MERLFLECVVRAALLVVATAIVLQALRVKAAATKHRIWAGVMALMLLLPLWTAWGPKVSLPVLPPLTQNIANKTKVPLEIYFDVSRQPTPVDRKKAVYLTVYLLGVCLLLLRLALGTVRSSSLVRGSTLHDGLRSSPLCAAPVTVGLVYPTVILPQEWQQWPQAQLGAVLTHESEHARWRHPLIQWLALLNRAIFWFHPAAWWLEAHLSALSEEACDNAVLASGYDRRVYSQYLIDMARSVERSGARLCVPGIAMPRSSLARRIRQILDGGSIPLVSRSHMAWTCVACAIPCIATAAVVLDHMPPDFSPKPNTTQAESSSPAHTATKFKVTDLKIEGDVHARDSVRDRVLKVLKNREYDNDQDLAEETAERIRADFQERGFFQVLVRTPSLKPLQLSDGKQNILIVASIIEGDQFRLSGITIQNVVSGQALIIPTATIREQFHLRDGDLFNTAAIRKGLGRVRDLYVGRGYAGASEEPDTQIDSSSHHIEMILRVTEGPHTP
jgi:beta-lactamase regulating signal transducer with metallopeptidase domain